MSFPRWMMRRRRTCHGGLMAGRFPLPIALLEPSGGGPAWPDGIVDRRQCRHQGAAIIRGLRSRLSGKVWPLSYRERGGGIWRRRFPPPVVRPNRRGAEAMLPGTSLIAGGLAPWRSDHAAGVGCVTGVAIVRRTERGRRAPSRRERNDGTLCTRRVGLADGWWPSLPAPRLGSVGGAGPVVTGASLIAGSTRVIASRLRSRRGVPTVRVRRGSRS